MPTLAGNIWINAVHGKGDTYLLLIFAPFLGLPLLDPRWLLPAGPPILLNLAATHGYQQEIRYQYLATAARSWPWDDRRRACDPGPLAGRHRSLEAIVSAQRPRKTSCQANEGVTDDGRRIRATAPQR